MEPVQTVLVAVDGSPESETAADYAIAIADRYGADVAALHVVDGAEQRAMATGELEPAEISDAAQALLDEIERNARERDVRVRQATAYGFSARSKVVHPGSVILDAAEEFPADFIVIPREPVEGRPPGEGTLAKAAEYCLQYASQPVLAI